MDEPKPAVRRRSDGEATRRRVLDAVVATVLDVGYYKASSNEIARRAGVTWGAIHRLFGSREQLMIDVVRDEWKQLESRLASEQVVGATLEERLREVMDVLATYYGRPTYLVQLQILLDAAANPKMSTRATRTMLARHALEVALTWQPLFTQALGEAAKHKDIVDHVFRTLRAYISSSVISDHMVEPEDDTFSRDMLVRGVAAAVREEAGRRGIAVE
jgi:AcrR family transcriptional regulator